ncbi:MAG: hypothetical protein QHH10_08965 [Peptococcaceae bacterium]|jgi:ribosome-binding protein aMBF1 (putative translation factor)|nr:hypothetical protein [Peptococcaceae bacterium]MDH7525427.1 hypothetical protein [Peptococcaceae bacterium]
MVCAYCGNPLNGHAFELVINDTVLSLCDEECAILYHQEQQQKNFRTWVKIR